jgi:hypothetical protein
VTAVIGLCAGREGIEIIGVHFGTKFGELILLIFGFVFFFINTSLFFEEGVNTASPALARTFLEIKNHGLAPILWLLEAG